MIKVYTVKSYVSINGGYWEHISHDIYTIRDDDPVEKVFLYNSTFNECCEYIKKHALDGIYLSYTLFRKKPIIYISDSYFGSHRYYHFDTISYKYIYEEWEDVPLTYIMEHFPADKCIQYLNERGSKEIRNP